MRAVNEALSPQRGNLWPLPVLFAAIAGCDGTVAPMPPVAGRSAGESYAFSRHAVLPAHHLYAAGDAVYEFPLDDGIPAATPSNVLNLASGNSLEVLSFAVGPDGSVYAGGYLQQGNYYAVNVYAPGASGNDPPVRTVNILHASADALLVDKQGFLFVGGLSDAGHAVVFVYLPGGNIPIQTIQVSQAYIPLGMALDHNGNLYVSSNESDVPIVVYGHPIARPHFLRTLCARRPATRIAIDERDDLYLSEGHFTRGDHPAVAVLNGRANSCPTKALRHISAERFRFTYVGAIATFAERLYVSVVLANGKFPIFTFDARRGRQVPLNILTLSGVDDFGEFLAVGP
jgi:hypothetical protein